MAGELRNEALRHVLGDVAAKLLASGFIGLCWGGFPNSTSPKTLAFQDGRRGVPCQESGLGFRGIFGTVARNPKRCQDRTPNRCRLAVSCAGSLLMLLRTSHRPLVLPFVSARRTELERKRHASANIHASSAAKSRAVVGFLVKNIEAARAVLSELAVLSAEGGVNAAAFLWGHN